MQEDIVRKSEEIIVYSSQGDSSVTLLDGKTLGNIEKYKWDDRNGLSPNCVQVALQYGVLMAGCANSSFLIQVDLGSNKIVRKSSCPEKLTAIVLS